MIFRKYECFHCKKKFRDKDYVVVFGGDINLPEKEKAVQIALGTYDQACLMCCLEENIEIPDVVIKLVKRK